MKVAIVGGGVAGLTAGYMLTKKGHEVHLYEKSDRIGGNAFTFQTKDGQNLDIAAAAFGKAGYKNFYKLLDELKVETELCARSYMSFHDLDTKEGLYLVAHLKGILQQGLSMLGGGGVKSPVAVAKLLLGVGQLGLLYKGGKLKDKTLGQALKMLVQFPEESKIMLLCALCLLSSMSAEELLESPAEFFAQKLNVHHDVVSPKAVYSVRCIRKGTQAYVHALAKPFLKNIALNANIKKVSRNDKGVTLSFKDGADKKFDRVIFACHADQALKLLQEPTSDEKELLGVWGYKDGKVVIHRDHSSFPARDLIQAYTFLYRKNGGKIETSVNGALWHEPQVSKDCDYISTQHPNFPIKEELVDFETVLRTPVFDFDSTKVIARLPSLNNKHHSFYCGSYFGFGLHEDAVSSAIEVSKFF